MLQMFSVFFLNQSNHVPVTLIDVDSQALEAYSLFQPTHDESVERKGKEGNWGVGGSLSRMAEMSQHKNTRRKLTSSFMIMV